MKLDLNNLPDLITNSEASKIFRVSPITVKRWGDKGDLKFIRINSRGDRRYFKKDILKILERKR